MGADQRAPGRPSARHRTAARGGHYATYCTVNPLILSPAPAGLFFAARSRTARPLDATNQSGRNPASLPLIAGMFHATGAVLGRGAHDLEFAHGMARLAPSGDGIKDDFYGGRSHLSEVHIASRLSFNSLRL